MADDQRLEKFAERIIRCAKFNTKVPSEYTWQLKRRNDSIEVEDKGDNDCTSEINHLVTVRLELFRVKLMELKEDLELFKNNDVDFVRYIKENMSKYFPYPRMNIFDKIFMSSAVVATMSRLLYLNGMSRKTAGLCWMMYFEAEFKEEFYAVENCWEAMKKYARSQSTFVKGFSSLCESPEKFETDFEFAEYARKQSEETYDYSGIIETFKQRIIRPLGSFCCSECLPLFDALYFLTFEKKLGSDFQLVEGYIQIFIRMAFLDTPSASEMFRKRIFKNDNFDNYEEEHGSYVCMFCDVKEEKSIAYLKSSIGRETVGEAANAEKVLDRNEERRALKIFMKFG